MSRQILLTTILLLLSGCNLAFTPANPNITDTPPPTRTLTFATYTDVSEATGVPNADTDANSTTATTTSTSDDTPTATDETCIPQSDWYEYTIQRGDNLTNVASRTRSTVNELIAANCLDNPNRIRVGDTIYVPNEPE